MRRSRLSVSVGIAFSVILLLLMTSNPLMAQQQPLFTGSESVPKDAIVLFDGKDLSNWISPGTDKAPAWKVENGYMRVVPGTGDIRTKQQFDDFQLHLEFWLPLMADARGQARSNSGVYLQGLYEIQVLDSYGLQSQNNDCGAIYGMAAPLVNACRPPEQWQTYDVIFHAPTVDNEGKMATNPTVTVLQNGVLIHDNYQIPGPTGSKSGQAVKQKGPILLQDHGNNVRYRNVWIRPLVTQ